MKKILISVIMLNILFLVACTNNAVMELDEEIEVWRVSSDWIGFDTLEEMAEWSTDVVRAKIISYTVGTMEFEGDYRSQVYTFYTIRILEVFQGNLQVGDEIELAQVGGKWENILVINEDEIPIEVGYDLVLFLITYPGFPAGFYQQGVYRLSEDLEATQEMDNSIELIPVLAEGMESSEFNLIVKDLWELDED